MAEGDKEPKDGDKKKDRPKSYKGLGRNPESKIKGAKTRRGLGRDPESKIKEAKTRRGLGRDPDSKIPVAGEGGEVDEDPNKDIENPPVNEELGGGVKIQDPFAVNDPNFAQVVHQPVVAADDIEQFKAFPFCIKASAAGGVIQYGSLVSYINRIGPTHDSSEQSGLCSPVVICPKNFVDDPQPDMCGTQLRMVELEWTGDVWLQWFTDYAGVVEAATVELVRESQLLPQRCLPHEGGGIFSVHIGHIPENTDEVALNHISSDVYFYGAFIDEDSSSSSSSSSSSGSPSSGSSKSAIVPAGFSETSYAALFSLESPEVRFEDTLEIFVWKGTSVIPIDSKFIEVCEPGSLKVCSICPSIAAVIGGRVEGAQIIVDSKEDCTAVIRITGVRKGFKNVRFPSRSEEQFEANEKFLKSAHHI
tara:strand:+ start:2448 stop:3704 length:1257 start_codon:yes stop_codon:yes gene_type:complete